jgi:hypothetical protein
MHDRSHDRNGREWVKLSSLKGGEILELDSGFTCRKAGPAHIHLDAEGLYFNCDEGKHYLDDQCDDGDHCVGIYGFTRPHLKVKD